MKILFFKNKFYINKLLLFYKNKKKTEINQSLKIF